MKKLIIVLFLCLSAYTNAQDLTNWQVGVNFNPFIFSRFNKSYENEISKQDLPNGLGFGLTIEKNWNENWGIKTGFEFTKQNEKYLFYTYLNTNTFTKATFEYYKLPITVQYFYPINYKLYLAINQGIQFSSLKYFKTVVSDDYQIITHSSNHGESIFFEHPEYNNGSYGDFQDYYHHKIMFGIIGSIGLKGFLSEKFSYSANIRYEYDFTDADKIPYYYFGDADTHNFRLGLELGLQYHFSIGEMFDKSPLKI